MGRDSALLHNLGVLTVAQVLPQLLNLAALVFLARTLGDRGFGLVQVGVAVSGYAMVLAQGGLLSLGIREVARFEGPDLIRHYVSTQQGLLGILAAVVLVAGALTLPLFPFYREDPVLMLLYLAAVVPQVFLLEWVGTGLEKTAAVGAAKVFGSLMYGLLVLGVLPFLDGFAGWPATRWVPVLFLVAFTLTGVVLARQAGRWLHGFARPVLPARSEARRRLADAAPIGASALTMRVLVSGDLILLGILASPEAVGLYAAPAKIGLLAVIAMEVLWKALLPRMSRYAGQSLELFRSRFRLYLALIVGAVLPLGLAGILAGPAIVVFVFGSEYDAGGPIFRVLAASYAALAVAWFLGHSLLAADRQRQFFPPLMIAAVTAMAGGLILIPRLGGLGAAFGMLAGHLLLLVLLGVVCRAWFDRSLARPALAVGTGLVIQGAVHYLMARADGTEKGVLTAMFLGLAAGFALSGPVLWRWWRAVTRARD